MDNAILVTLKQKLEEERAKIAHLLGKIDRDKLPTDDGFVPPSTHGQDDEAERVADMELDIATEGNLRERMANIEHALAKFAEGSYGKCDGCGKQIQLQRLDFLPAARYCISCQREQDNPS